MAHSYRYLKSDGHLEVFSRDTLYISIHDALSHRPHAVSDAGDITATILAHLINNHRLVIERHVLIDTVLTILKRFDKPAYVKYSANHPKTV